MNDFYKTCRWCRYFKDGKCWHNKTFRSGNKTGVISLAEEGIISEAIEEVFPERTFSNIFSKLRIKLESSLSKKKAAEIMRAFSVELEYAKDDWIDYIDEAITMVLKNAVDEETEDAAEIIDPEEFCCKYWR